MAWALHRTEKEKPAAGKTDYWRDFWRSGWDSNPRNLAVQLISSQSRYDHFDTAPYLSQHQHLGKRGELMGRTSKNIKLRIPEKPRKIKGFRTGSYRVATTISSATPSTSWVMLLIVIPQNLLRKKERKVGENSKYLIVENSGFLTMSRYKINGSFQNACLISSAPSYDLLGNAPCSGFLPDTKLV